MGSAADLIDLRRIEIRSRTDQLRGEEHSVAQVRVDQSRQILRLRVQLLQEKSGVAELVLVGRILEQLERFVAGHLHLFGTVLEGEVAQRFDGGDVGRVVEAPLIGGRLRDDDVRQFLREHRGEAGFVGQHVEQAAAEHDGVADGERFESAGE